MLGNWSSTLVPKLPTRMTTSTCTDVCDATFGRFWKILKDDYGLNLVKGKGLVDNYYSLNAGVVRMQDGLHGVDYFTKEEVIVQLNKPENKERFAECFESLKEYVEKKRKVREAAEQERRKRPHAFEASPDGVGPFRRYTKEKGSYVEDENDTEFESDAATASDGEEKAEQPEDKTTSQKKRAARAVLNETRKAQKRRAGRSVRENNSSADSPRLYRYNFHVFWEIVSKRYKLRTFKGKGRISTLYCVEPDDQRKADACSRNGAIEYFNAHRAQFQREFELFEEQLRKQKVAGSKTNPCSSSQSTASSTSSPDTNAERSSESKMADESDHMRSFLRYVKKVRQRAMDKLSKERTDLTGELTHLQSRLAQVKARLTTLAEDEAKLRKTKVIVESSSE